MTDKKKHILRKSKKVVMDKKEFIKEHKNLINVLNSPSREDDKAEAKKQKKELREYVKAFKKSYDYRDHGVMVDSSDQKAAEESVNSDLLQYLHDNTDNLDQYSTEALELGKGILKITKKDHGLFNGWWEDEYGQASEKFEDQTLAMIAKTLSLKGIYQEAETEPPPVETPEEKPYIRIKYGDFEFELKKSLKDLEKSVPSIKTEDLKKSVRIWKSMRASHLNQKQATKEILDNWDKVGEDFNQILFAVKKLKGE